MSEMGLGGVEVENVGTDKTDLTSPGSQNIIDNNESEPAGGSSASLFTPVSSRKQTSEHEGAIAQMGDPSSSSQNNHKKLPTTAQSDEEGSESDTDKNPSISHPPDPERAKRQSSAELSPLVESKEFVDTSLSIIHAHKRHVFILSEAGKPIYSRQGSEEDFSTLMGVMQALVSFVSTRDDKMDSFTQGDWNFVFLSRNHLILILSTLTSRQLDNIFKRKENFDLRRLISGTEKTLSALVDLSVADPSHLLCAVRCLPLPFTTRDNLGQALLSAIKSVKDIKNLVFGLVIGKCQLVTMVRLKRYTLHPSDLHLLINLIHSNPSFRNAETWSPICLPRFDDSGFLHAHISYLGDKTEACLVLMTVDRDAFYSLAEVRDKFLDKIVKNKSLAALNQACNDKQGVPLYDVGIPDVLHFLYKNRSSSQLCMATLEPPFVSEGERQGLIDGYLQIIDRIHNSPNLSQPLRILYATGDKHALLGWVTTNFELYVAFNPMITKQAAVAKVDKLMKWLKKEEERLFILSPLVF